MTAQDQLYKIFDRILPQKVIELLNTRKQEKQDWSKVQDLLLKIAKIQKETRRYKEFWNSSREALILLTPSTGQILDANPAACALYGYPCETLRGLSILDLSLEVEGTKEAYNSRSTFVPFRAHKTRDGHKIMVTISISYFTDNGSGTLAALIIRPILEKRVHRGTVSDREKRRENHEVRDV